MRERERGGEGERERERVSLLAKRVSLPMIACLQSFHGAKSI